MFRLNYFDAHICSTQRELYWDELLSSGIDSDVWKKRENVEENVEHKQIKKILET